MEIRNDAQRMAIKAALIRFTSDQSWTVIRNLADETVYNLEQKSLQEDDEEKAKTYRHDARGARRFWAGLLKLIELAKEADGDNFNEVIM